MAKFQVYAAVGGSKYLGEFEAGTPEAAAELAYKSGEDQISLCHQCSSECENPEVLWVDVTDEAGETAYTDNPDCQAQPAGQEVGR